MDVERIPPTDTDTAEELNRLLEIARILSTVLTPEEVETLRLLLGRKGSGEATPLPITSEMEIGNTSVT